MNKRSSTKVDIHVGKKLRRRRELLGLSQTEIAERIDLSHQQLQKYENATNRISAGKLFEFGQILDIPVTYFYDGLTKDQSDEYAEDDIEMLIKDKDVLKLLRKYITLTKKNPEYIKIVHAILDVFLKNETPY